MNFPLTISFVTSHKCWYISILFLLRYFGTFPFCLSWGIFKISFLISSLTNWLLTSMLFSLYIYLRRTYILLLLGECPVCVSVFVCMCICVLRSYVLLCHLRVMFLYCYFCPDNLPIDVSRILKSSTIIVAVSFSL